MSVWVYEVVEVHDRRANPIGKFRCVRWPDDQPHIIEGLCNHSHETRDEALHCSAVCAVLDVEFRERPSPPATPRLS